MARFRIAALVAAGTLAVGGGIALADTAPPEPEVTDDAELTDETDLTDDTAVTEADDVEGSVEQGDEVEGTGDEGDEDGAGTRGHEDANHGATVSAAAQDHTYDEACGNHGRYVSHWARHGEAPDCATDTDASGSETVDTDADTTGDETTGDTTSGDEVEAQGGGDGPGRPAHAGKPAHAGGRKGR